MEYLIGKVTPESLYLAFGLVGALVWFAWPFTLGAATHVALVIVIGVDIGVGLYEVDMEGSFGGWVCGPVVWDDGDLVLNVGCRSWAGW